MEVERCVENKAGRSLIRDSQIIKINPSVATKEIIDPTEDTTFHAR